MVKRGGTHDYAPLGYLNVTQRVDGKEIKSSEVDPERGPHIQWLFETYAVDSYLSSPKVLIENPYPFRT